jgi:hypothetical protein
MTKHPFWKKLRHALNNFIDFLFNIFAIPKTEKIS